METKAFYTSKVLWTQVFSVILSALSAGLLPNEYKLIAVSVINLLNMVFTVAFRWDTSIPLGWSKK
jgi:hypothetical protein